MWCQSSALLSLPRFWIFGCWWWVETGPLATIGCCDGCVCEGIVVGGVKSREKVIYKVYILRSFLYIITET